jgi:hypothetical protein
MYCGGYSTALGRKVSRFICFFGRTEMMGKVKKDLEERTTIRMN